MPAHSTLTGANLHEVKGAAGATAGHVYVADGSGSAAFVSPLTIENISISSSISNSKTTALNPSSTDTPLLCSFDSTTSNSDVDMDSSGVITILQDGLYFLTFNLNFGRSTTTSTAIVTARMLINDVAFGYSQGTTLGDNVSSRPGQFNVYRSFSAGDTVKIQIMRDSAGQNDGGLLPVAITSASWVDVPAFWARVNKIGGAA